METYPEQPSWIYALFSVLNAGRVNNSAFQLNVSGSGKWEAVPVWQTEACVPFLHLLLELLHAVQEGHHGMVKLVVPEEAQASGAVQRQLLRHRPRQHLHWDFTDAFIQSDLQPFIHTPTAESTTQDDSQLVRISQGLIMVPRSRNAMTTQMLQRSREVVVLRQVLVSGPMTALAAASPQRKVTLFGRRASGPCGGHKEGPQGHKGSITPLRCANMGS